MKRAFFLIAVVTFVCMLSSCAELIIFLIEGVPYHFENHSSHVVNVGSDLDYTYTPSDLVKTGTIEGSYGFWDK
jgi:hypothetical protein